MSERKNYSRQISKSPRVPKRPPQSLDKSTDNPRRPTPSSARTFNLSLDTCHACYFPEPRQTPEYRISSAPPNFPFPSPKKDSKGEKLSKSERRKLKDLSLRNGFLMNEKFLKNPAHYTSDFERRKTSELQIPEEFYVLPTKQKLQQIEDSKFYFSNEKNKASDGKEKAARIGENALTKKKAGKGASPKAEDHVKKIKPAPESAKPSTPKESSGKNKHKPSWIHSRPSGLPFGINLSPKKSFFSKHQRTPAQVSSKSPKQTPIDTRLNSLPAPKSGYDQQPLTTGDRSKYYNFQPASMHVNTQNRALDNKIFDDDGKDFNSLYVRDKSITSNSAGNKLSHTSYGFRPYESEPNRFQTPDLDKEKRQLLAENTGIQTTEYPENFIRAIKKHLRRSVQPIQVPGFPPLQENFEENSSESDFFPKVHRRKRKSRQRSVGKDRKSLEADLPLESITETDYVIENRVPYASIVPASTNRVPSTDYITPDNKTTNIPNQKPLNLQTNALPSTFPESEAYAGAKVKPTNFYKKSTGLNQTPLSKRTNALPSKISGIPQAPMQANVKPGSEYKPTNDQNQYNMQTNASSQNSSKNQDSGRMTAKPNVAQNQKPLSIQSNVTPPVLPRGQEYAQTKIRQPQNQIPFNTQTNVIPTNLPGNQDPTKTNVKPITQFKPNTAQNEKSLAPQSNVTPTVLPGIQDNAQAKIKQIPEYRTSIAPNQAPPNASIVPSNLPGNQDPTRMNFMPTNQFKPNISQNQKPLAMQKNVTPSAAPAGQDNTRAKRSADYKSGVVTNQLPFNTQTNTLPSNFPRNQDPTQAPKKAISDYGPSAGVHQKSHSIPSNAYQSNITENQDYTQAKMKPTTERKHGIMPNQKSQTNQMQTRAASDYMQNASLNQKLPSPFQTNVPNQKPYSNQGSVPPSSFPRNQDQTQMQTKPTSDYIPNPGANQKPYSIPSYVHPTNIPENQDYTQAKMKPTTEGKQSITPNQKSQTPQGSSHPSSLSRNQDPKQMQMRAAPDYAQSAGLNQKAANAYQTNIPESQDHTQGKIRPTPEQKQGIAPSQKPHSNQGSTHQPSFPENQYAAKGRMKPASEYKPNIADIQNSYNVQANVYQPKVPAAQEPIKSSLKPTSQFKPTAAQGQKPLQPDAFPLTFSSGTVYPTPNDKIESVSRHASKNFPMIPDNKAAAYGQKIFDKQGLEHKPLIVDQSTKGQFFESRDTSQRPSRVYEKHAHSDSSNTPKSLSYQSDGGSSNPSQCSKCSSNRDAVKKLGLFSDSQPLFPENIKILSSKTSVRPENTSVEPTRRSHIPKDRSYFPHYQRLTNLPDIISTQKPSYHVDLKPTNEVPATKQLPTSGSRIPKIVENDTKKQPSVHLQPQTVIPEPVQKTQVADERPESNKPNFPTNRKATETKMKTDVPTKKKAVDKEVLKVNPSKTGRQNVMFQLSRNPEANTHNSAKTHGPDHNQRTESHPKAQPKNFNVYTLEYNDPNKALIRSIGPSFNEKQLDGQNFGFSAQRNKFIDPNTGLQDLEYREVGLRRGSRLFVETGLPLVKPSEKSTTADSFSKTDLRNVVVYPFEYDDRNRALVQKMSDALHPRHVDKVNILASVPNANFINPNVGFQLLNPENDSQLGSTLFLESELPIVITPEQSRNAGFYSNADPQHYGAYFIEYDGRNNALSPNASSPFYQRFSDQPGFQPNAPYRTYDQRFLDQPGFESNAPYGTYDQRFLEELGFESNAPYKTYDQRFLDQPGFESNAPYRTYDQRFLDKPDFESNIPYGTYDQRFLDQPGFESNAPYGTYDQRFLEEPGFESNAPYKTYDQRFLDQPGFESNAPYGTLDQRVLDKPDFESNIPYGTYDQRFLNQPGFESNAPYGTYYQTFFGKPEFKSNAPYGTYYQGFLNQPGFGSNAPYGTYISPNDAYPLPGSQTSLKIITLSAWHPSRRVQSSETESLSPYYENGNAVVSATATLVSLSSSGSQDLEYDAFGNRFAIEDSDSYSFGSSQSDFQDPPTGFSQPDFVTSDDLQSSSSYESAISESANLQPYTFGYSGPYGALSDEFGTIFCQKLSGTQILECEVPELLFSGTESGSLFSEKSYYTLSSETLIPEPPLPIFDVPQTQKHSQLFGHNADFGSPGMQSQEHSSPLDTTTFSPGRSCPDSYPASPTQTSVSTCFAPQNPYGMANQTFCIDQSSPGGQLHPNPPVGRAFCPGRFTSAPEVPMNQSYVLPNTGGHPSHLNQSYVVDPNRSSPGGALNQTFGVGNATGSPCPPQNQSYVIDQNTGSPCVAANQTFGVGNNTGSPRSPAHQTFEIGQSYSSPCALLNQTFNAGNPCPAPNQTFTAGSASGSPCPNQTFNYSPHHNLNQTFGAGNANPCANQTFGVCGPCGPAQQTPPGMQHDGAMIDPSRTVNVSQPFMNRTFSIGSPSPGGGAGPIDPNRTFDVPVCKLPYKTPNFIRVERKKKELAFNASDLDSSDPDPYSPESGVEFFTPERKYQTSFMNSRTPCANTSYYPSVSSPSEPPVRASTFCIEYKDQHQSTPRPSLSAQDKNRFQPVGEDTGDDDLILDIISHHLSKLSTPSRGICTGRQEKPKCLPKEPPKKTPTRGRTLPKMPELTDEDICNLIQCEKEDVNSVSYLMSDARKVYKKPCPKQQKAQMNVQNIAKSITSRPTTSQSLAPDCGKSQASAIEPDPEDISPDLAANMMFSQEEGIELEGPPTKTVNYLFPESKESDQDKIAVAGGEANEEENMVEKSQDVPEEGVSDSAYAKIMMMKGGRSKGASYEMDVALGHEKREYVLVPKKPIRYNKIQYRGNLPTWFPGYFSSFPDDHGGIKLVSSPSQLLQKAWMWTAPLNLPPSDIIILD